MIQHCIDLSVPDTVDCWQCLGWATEMADFCHLERSLIDSLLRGSAMMSVSLLDRCRFLNTWCGLDEPERDGTIFCKSHYAQRINL